MRARRGRRWASELPRVAGVPLATAAALALFAIPPLGCAPSFGASGDGATGGEDGGGPPIVVEVLDGVASDGTLADAADASSDGAPGDVAEATSCIASGTGAVAVLGCPCETTGALACGGNAKTQQLVCLGGAWTDNGTCPAGKLCDSRSGATQGTCVAIAPACTPASPGQNVCLDLWTVGQCGPDLVSVSTIQTCKDQVCSGGGCTGVCAPPVTGGQLSRCSGATLETCGTDGQWGTSQSCSSACCTDACVDLTTDAHNCGACGHDCQGGGCSQSACQPVVLDSSDLILGVAIDAQNLYLTTTNQVLQLALAGGSRMVLADGYGATGITVDGTSVYFTNGGTVNGSDGTVIKIPIGGGAATTLATGQAMPSSIAVDSTNVYFATGGYTPGQGAVVSVPIAGGTPVTLASGKPPVSQLATDSTGVYFTTSDCGFVTDGGTCSGAVMKVMRGGTPVTIAAAQNGAAGLAVEPTAVYWTTSMCTPANDGGSSCTGTIAKIGLYGGGAPTTIASGLGAGALVVDGPNVYFTSASGIMRVAVDGGAITTVASDAVTPVVLVQDSTALYWTDLSCPAGSSCIGTLQKVAKP